MEEIKTRIVLTGQGSRISRLRLTASAPFLVSVVAFVLTIVLLIAGTKPGMMQDYDILAVSSSVRCRTLMNPSRIVAVEHLSARSEHHPVLSDHIGQSKESCGSSKPT
jgi:hypothetical protein